MFIAIDDIKFIVASFPGPAQLSVLQFFVRACGGPAAGNEATLIALLYDQTFICNFHSISIYEGRKNK